MQAPLHGIRVIDLSAVVSGPMATGLLADQGADVIKVEPHSGDLTRVIGPAKGDISAMFASINRGKRSVVLDLKHPQGRAVLEQLIATADVLVENFRPGVMQRLGLGYDTLGARHPLLIYLSIAGLGHDGPQAGFRVYDPVIQAVSGFADAHPDPTSGEPRLLQTLLCDKITALTAAQAVSSALVARYSSGQGQHITLSMLDAAVSFLWPEALYNHSFQDDSPPVAPEFGAQQRLWQAADGWVALITPQNDEFYALCRALDMPELITDPRFVGIPERRTHQAELRALLEPKLRAETVATLVSRLGPAGVPIGQVNTKQQLAQDAQVCHNALLRDNTQPGLGRWRSPRPAARFAQSPTPASAPAPHLGEHTCAILTELGHSPANIQHLLATGVAHTHASAH